MENLIKKGIIRPDNVVQENDPLIKLEEREREWSRIFKIWYVEPGLEFGQMQPERLVDDYELHNGPIETDQQLRAFIDWRNQKKEKMVGDAEKYLAERDKLAQLEDKRIKEVQKEPKKRPFLVNFMNGGDVRGAISCEYDISHSNPPEIIIMRQDKEAYGSSLGSGAVAAVRRFIHEAIVKNNLTDKESILQPIIVVVCQDEELKTTYLEQGANLVAEDFQIDDIEKIAQLAAKIKSDPASLNTEGFLAEKIGFYQQIVDNGFMGERGELSADTEQELEILRKIFQENNIHKILDVGSGSGRLTNELGKDETLEIVGVDANEKLLKLAQEKSPDLERIKYQKGRITDYVLFNEESKKMMGQFEAVTYTWNTILEAFGPGNLIKTLNNAWLALKEGGQLVFDLPTRENSFIKDGWYHIPAGEAGDYWAYIPTQEEIEFVLRMTGFDLKTIKFKKWAIAPSEEYPDGIKKITVVVNKK
ncbi:MAG TPA: class I SAM-dependent methyltransferase [bacterium]|nr:class I SAM-dependent methyltransferase [bacterium]HPL95872.1 class I SAM-dependent methyltransferase [bacterium]